MGRVTLVLGAGASRGVSYAHQGRIPSPLDGDFFDLLQRLEPSDRDEPAVKFILHQCSTIADYELRRSMERALYTLHLRAYLREKLLGDPKAEHETELLVGNFARAVQSLLRAAHGKRVCEQWRVSIVGSRAKEDWEMKVEGPNGFERSYTLVGNAGEHQPVAIGNLLLRMLPSKTS
jgi:hypothetical protein